MSFGLREIPERIRELHSLKHLTIFEQDIRTLPHALFELESLESLTIQVADLEELPADIAKLTRLKSLRISCGCYDRPAPDFIYKMTWLDRFLIEDKPFHLCNHGDD
ncbi:hypothetical protein D3C74_151920 [compost metagenome]